MSIRRKKERLPVAIGRELRLYREREGISGADLARAARISGGTLSKIEHGTITASLTIIQSLSRILGVSLSSLMQRAEHRRNALFVGRDRMLPALYCDGSEGVRNYSIGSVNCSDRHYRIESSIVVIFDCEMNFELNRNQGKVLVYMLEGELIYRHGSNIYTLLSGDSLSFDAEWPHGPDRAVKSPARFLQVHAH